MNLFFKLEKKYTEFINSKIPHNLKKSNLFFFGLLAIALPITVILAQQIQDIRQRAAEVDATPATPPDLPNHSIFWKTASAELKVGEFYVDVNGKRFYSNNTVQLSSDPSNNTNPDYTTLEATWNENGVEMRMNMYFTYSNTGLWKLYDLRTYDGSPSGNWVYYEPTNQSGEYIESKLGNPYANAGIIEFRSKNDNPPATIHFENTVVYAFTDLLSPSITSCQAVNVKTYTPLSNCGNNRYHTIRYVCADGYVGQMGSATSCQDFSVLKQYADSSCAQRTSCSTKTTPVCTKVTISRIRYSQSCNSSNTSYKSASYTCSDGFTGQINNNQCNNRGALNAEAILLCQKRTTCTNISCDINRDNQTNSNDYAKLLQCIANGKQCTSADQASADLNHDGKVNIVDYNYYQRSCRNPVLSPVPSTTPIPPVPSITPTVTPDPAAAQILGMIFLDQNKNGALDSPGDKNYTGQAKVELLENGQVLHQTITGNLGFFDFLNVKPGITYQIHVLIPTGYVATTPNIISITPIVGVSPEHEFGIYQLPL